ncbi:MAG: 4-hydroxy-tetrahydrodipicolinate reductase [archaeon]
MQIAIVGYGKMGKAAEAAAKLRGHSVTIIDPIEEKADFKEINQTSLAKADVCIDFTTPTVAIENAKKIAALGKNIVMGTTGWYERMEEMKSATNKIGFIWSGNYSVGMNVFFEAVKATSKIMNNLPEYDAAVCETHHNQKKDSPGGSAQIIANIIIQNMARKKKIQPDRIEGKPNPEELHVASIRCGSIPGTHVAIFDCPADTIELKHIARGREGFAVGAVMAAEFINGKKGFFGMDDFMRTIISR